MPLPPVLSRVTEAEQLVQLLATVEADVLTGGAGEDRLNDEIRDFLGGLRDEIETGSEMPGQMLKASEDARQVLQLCDERGCWLFAGRALSESSRPVTVVVAASRSDARITWIHGEGIVLPLGSF